MSQFEEVLQAAPVIAIIRHAESTFTAATLDSLASAGIRLAEVTSTTPAWADHIKDADPRLLMGAGTITSVDQVEAAAAAGARFIVSPGFDSEVVTATVANGMYPLPGVATPSDISAAIRIGVRTVKLFPASHFGPTYLKALLGPYPHVRFLPTGGVNADNAASWIDAGAVGVAVGGDLVGRTSTQDPQLLKEIGEKASLVLAVTQLALRGSP